MALKCPMCGASIPARNINVQKTLALCHQCEHVFDFSQHIKPRKAKPRKVKPPHRVQVYEDENQLELSFRFLPGPGSVFGLVMSSIVFFGSLVGLASGVIGMIPLVMIFGYFLAVFLTTTTHLVLDDDALEVRSGPLPFPLSDNVVINRDDIRRIFRQETTEPPGLPAYHVVAGLENGEEVIVLRALPRTDAYQIAQIIEARLQTDLTPLNDAFFEDVSEDDSSHTESADFAHSARLVGDTEDDGQQRVHHGTNFPQLQRKAGDAVADK